jgi:hypothetical protein
MAKGGFDMNKRAARRDVEPSLSPAHAAGRGGRAEAGLGENRLAAPTIRLSIPDGAPERRLTDPRLSLDEQDAREAMALEKLSNRRELLLPPDDLARHAASYHAAETNESHW